MNITKSVKSITATLALATLVACSSGGSCPPNLPVQEAGKLVFVAPSILPSLANKTGINYMGVYNPSKTTINGISYSLGQQVGAGNSITLDSASAKACATIPAQNSCFLKFSVPESTIAGGTVVTATNSSGQEAATPLAIGVQQIPYTESANANGVGLYFYPKAQYSANGVPFILVTAVVQSPNVDNINTIQLVDESGNIIPDQTVVSNNSGAGKAALQMGDVVEISLPIPQGINLTQNFKVQTSSQSLVTTALNSLAAKLNFKSLEASSNGNISSTTYTLTTQGNNINLQLTPNQVYLTQKNPVQYGYLYNIGDLTASQITVTSSSPNVRVTAANTILNGQRVIKVTYELINTSVGATSNSILVTANNPSGQTESSTGGTSQNVNPLPVPTPSPTPTPTPTVSPTPGPAPLPLTVSSSQNPIAIPGGMCSTIGAALPEGSTAPVGGLQITFNLSPIDNNAYGFGTMLSSPPYVSSASCTIGEGETSCLVSSEISALCAGGSSPGTQFTVSATTTGYVGNTQVTTVVAPACDPCTIFVTNPVTNGNLTTNVGNSWEAIDNICATDSNNPGTGTYKAMLVGIVNGVTRQACTTADCTGGISENSNWVLHPNTTYNNLSSALVFNTNADAIAPGLTTSVSNRSITGGSVDITFTGLLSNWTTANTCNSWSSASVSDSADGGYPNPTVITGNPFALHNFWYGSMGGPNNCADTQNGVYCVQQNVANPSMTAGALEYTTACSFTVTASPMFTSTSSVTATALSGDVDCSGKAVTCNNDGSGNILCAINTMSYPNSTCSTTVSSPGYPDITTSLNLIACR